MALPDIAQLIERLDVDVERPQLPRDPYQFILYENAGYLVDDARRAALFARMLKLAKTPAALLETPAAALLAIARDGGMRPESRVERWQAIARSTLDAGGDLRAALLSSDDRGRRTLLRQFPSIGDPGADLVRLFCLDEARASIESNGIRVLLRLGMLGAGAAYAAHYREATTLLSRTFAAAADLQRAWFVLRHHGKAICRRSAADHAACRAGKRCNSALV